MKITHCFSLVIAFILFAGQAHAQTKVDRIGKTKIAFQGGINIQSINGKDTDGNSLKGDVYNGFNLGILAETKFAREFYFQPGLLVSTKGANNLKSAANPGTLSSIKITYLEMPLNLLYKPAFSKGNLILGVGSHISYALGGKSTLEIGGAFTEYDLKFKNKVDNSASGNAAYMRPLDAGLNLIAGYEFKNHVSFQLNAQLGLAKINPEYPQELNDKSSAQNTGFGVSMGYRF